MEYTIKELSTLANISTRTLRYYDQINLLSPSFINNSGYRIYTSTEVDLLQQIMFYKELDLELKDIKKIIDSDDYNKLKSFKTHYIELNKKQNRINFLIKNVEKTIYNTERNILMNDKEKFEGFKDALLKENTDKYGDELLKKYDNDFVKESYKKFKKLSKYQMEELEKLSQLIDSKLIEAVNLNDTNNSISKELCQLHEKWIKGYWPSYTKEAHMSLVESYLLDERFKSYYDKRIKGGALFLRDAMKIYLTKK